MILLFAIFMTIRWYSKLDPKQAAAYSRRVEVLGVVYLVALILLAIFGAVVLHGAYEANAEVARAAAEGDLPQLAFWAARLSWNKFIAIFLAIL